MPDIKNLKGIGPAKSKLFAQLELSSVSDLLHYYPRTYQDRRIDAPLSQFKRIENVCGIFTVLRTQSIPVRGLLIFKAFLLDDNNNMVEAVWFKKKVHRFDPFMQMRRDFKANAKLWIIGKKENKNRTIQNLTEKSSCYSVSRDTHKTNESNNPFIISV